MMRLTIDKGVENRHRAVGDTRIWVNLLENYKGVSVRAPRIGKKDMIRIE